MEEDKRLHPEFYGYDYPSEDTMIDDLLSYPNDYNISLYHHFNRRAYRAAYEEYLIDNGYSFQD